MIRRILEANELVPQSGFDAVESVLLSDGWVEESWPFGKIQQGKGGKFFRHPDVETHQIVLIWDDDDRSTAYMSVGFFNARGRFMTVDSYSDVTVADAKKESADLLHRNTPQYKKSLMKSIQQGLWGEDDYNPALDEAAKPKRKKRKVVQFEDLGDFYDFVRYRMRGAATVHDLTPEQVFRMKLDYMRSKMRGEFTRLYTNARERYRW